ncbi:protein DETOXIFICATION 42 isoform X1 [Cryptomeria japonica]|uniref:protein DETOXIFICATION 42 isoform X1 n=1 Tax=Cryptomeria japonica TaxID=3369 RepID=UPI0025AD2D8F|nr:protein DETOXIFICATION 42 isoform X1 [Cryptomeria japonica]
MDSESNSEGVNPAPVNNQSHWNPFKIFFVGCRNTLKLDTLGREITRIAVPAALALTADPVASIIDTAFIGRIGPVELAAVGVSIAIVNQISKVFNFPLVSVTTSLVAEEDATTEMVVQGPLDIEKSIKECTTNPINIEKDVEDATKGVVVEGLEIAKSIKECPANPTNNEKDSLISCPPITSEAANTIIDSTTATLCIEKRLLPSVSSALVIGAVLGILQALIMIVAAKPILSIMGVHAKSPMRSPAERYLKLRAFGAPAVVISLATQGVFRGFKDTMTPLYATLAADISNIALDPVLIFVLKFGVGGAAIAHVVSQYLMALILLFRLHKQVVLLPPKLSDLQFARFFKSGGLLLARVTAVTVCTTLAASMAARQGAISMAAFQICNQIWLATSLLADALALAGQAILASAFAIGDYEKARNAAARTLQMGMVLGIFLGVVLSGGVHIISRLFSNDIHVLKMTYIGMPFVAATQPLNSLAFVFDGINFGASDFAFAAYSMVIVSMITIGCLLTLSAHWGFVGVWIALTIMMTLRMLAGVWRIGTGSGPWRFLRTWKGSPL